MSDTTTEQPPEHQDRHDALVQTREALKRAQDRVASLERLPAEVARLRRELGLARVGVDPNSVLGTVALTQAEANGTTDPDEVGVIVRALRAELMRED